MITVRNFEIDVPTPIIFIPCIDSTLFFKVAAKSCEIKLALLPQSNSERQISVRPSEPIRRTQAVDSQDDLDLE